MVQQQIQDCIAVEELKQLLQQSAKSILVIDVRSSEEYSVQHIPAAVNIPLQELVSRSFEFSDDVKIVTACFKGGGRSAEGAALLQQAGFRNAIKLCGGTYSWFEAEKPI